MSGRLEGADKVEKEGEEGDLKNHRNAKGLESDFFFFLCSLQNTLGAAPEVEPASRLIAHGRTQCHEMRSAVIQQSMPVSCKPACDAPKSSKKERGTPPTLPSSCRQII